MSLVRIYAVSPTMEPINRKIQWNPFIRQDDRPEYRYFVHWLGAKATYRRPQRALHLRYFIGHQPNGTKSNGPGESQRLVILSGFSLSKAHVSWSRNSPVSESINSDRGW